MKYLNNFATTPTTSPIISNDVYTVSDATQTSFALSERPSSAKAVLVTKNGLSLVPVLHYTVLGNTLTLTDPAILGDKIEVRYFIGSQGPKGDPGAFISTTDQVIITSNTTNATSAITGALIVSGGAGIGKDLYVAGNLTIAGTVSYIDTQNVVINDSLIELHATENFNPLTSDDGKDVGIRIHYYKSTNKNAFLGWSNTTGYLEYYSDGAESAQGKFSGTLGTAKFGGLITTGNITANTAYASNYFYANGTALSSALSFTGGNIANNVSIQSNTVSTSTTTGALTVAGGVGIDGNLYVGTISTTGAGTVGGLLTAQQISEKISTKTAATGTVDHDFSTGIIFYHSQISGNFTVNFTNVPTTDNRAITATLVLVQGTTPYYATGLKINGVDQTFTWPYSAAPTPTANVLEIQSFTLFRVGGIWKAVAQYMTFG